MEDFSNYRETPNTGRAPMRSEHELDPIIVDPTLLTDDRLNPDLLTFEKTWGHRTLAGIGVAMLVIAVVLIVFSLIQIFRIVNILDVLPVAALNMYMYVAGLVSGIALILPALIAIYVAKHPSKVIVAIVAAIIALVLVVMFFFYAISITPQFIITAVLYSILLAIIPVVYLIAALKIKSSL